MSMQWGDTNLENDYDIDLGQTSADGTQFVTFRLGEEEYGVEITMVQEIIGYQGLTKLPNVSDYIRGVLNLRGAVVPVIDLRLKLGMPPREYDKFTVILVVEVQGRTMGVIVDGVSDVVGLTPDAIQPPPSISTGVRADYVRGMAAKGDKFIVLLDTDKILSADELEEVDSSV